MKKIYLILSLAMATLFVACKDESYEQPNTFSDVGFYTGGARQNVLRSTVGNYMSFMDLSQGTVDHTWTIQEGNFFLEGPIERRDTVFEQFIINRGDTVSKEDVVHVLFSNGGFNEVTLHNTFHDSVAFRGNNGVEDYILPSVKVGDLWVIDTTFVVDVYEDIVPEIEIRQDGALVSHESPSDVITVEVGGTLEFTDLTTIGRPTSRVWTVAGEQSSEQVFETVFKKLGVQNAQINLTRSGEFIPGGSARYVVPATINVVPSSKPFQLTGTIAEQEDESIHIPFNGEFAAFSGKEAFFQAKVNGDDFVVESVVINPDDATELILKLVEPIYSTDAILVSLLDGSGITSTDTRVPVSFTEEPVTMFERNLITENRNSFEEAGAKWPLFTAAWAASFGGNHVGGTADFTTDMATDGIYSMKLSMVAGQRCAVRSDFETPVEPEAGKTYVFSYDVYIESSNVAPLDVSMWFLGQWKGFDIGIDVTDPANQGKWITRSFEATGAEIGIISAMYFRIRSVNPDQSNAATGTSDFSGYFDNFRLIEKEERP